MIFIFEDTKSSDTAQLFISSYPDEVVNNKFVYTDGHTKIVETIEKLNKTIEDKNKIFIVFLDMPPGNENIIDTYYRIRKLCRDDGFENTKILIIPIVCSEYYVIKLIINQELIPNDEIFQSCIERKYYENSVIITSNQDRNFCTSFEKYCKLVLKKHAKNCMSPSKAFILDKGNFYKNDCSIDCSEYEKCKEITKREKSKQLLKEYPIVPSGSFNSEKIEKNCEYSMMLEIHKKLVEEYNDWTDKYFELDSRNMQIKKKKYKHIPFFEK